MLPKLKTLNSNRNQVATLNQINQETIWFENFISENTKETYKPAIKQFIDFLGIKSLDQLRHINNIHVIRFRDSLIDQGKSDSTINNRLSAISSLFNHLIEKQVVQINPVIGVKRCRMNYNIVKSRKLSRQNVSELLHQTNKSKTIGARDSAIFHILFYTGCRISELAQLKVKDYFEDDGYKVLNFKVKGGKYNVVALNIEAHRALDQYLKLSGHHISDNSPLLLNVSRNPEHNKEKPLTRNALTKIWRRHVSGIGLEKCWPHSARSTFITQALENGTDIADVQATVAHNSIRTTKMYDQRLRLYKNSASFAVRY